MRNVALALTIRPSGVVDRKPQARARRAAPGRRTRGRRGRPRAPPAAGSRLARTRPRRGAGVPARGSPAIARIVSSGALSCGRARSPRAAPGCRGSRHARRSPPSGRDEVVAALQHEGGHRHAGQVGGVGQERDLRELAGDGWPIRQKLVVSPSRPARPVRVVHDGRRHGRRPAEVVALQRAQHLHDVGLGEGPVGPVVDVARRGPTITRLAKRSGSAAWATTPIIDETEWPTNTTSQVELADDLRDVVGVPLQRVTAGVVR